MGAANAADIATISGTVRIGLVAGTVDVQDGQREGHAVRRPVGARSAPGRSPASVTIHLPPNVRPDVRASDARWVHCRCDEGDDVTIDVASMSGKVEIIPS